RNNGDFTFKSRYNGEDFEIPPGGIEEMTVECAQLCFGLGEDDKSRCLRRLGWPYMKNKDGSALGELGAVQMLGRFSFHMSESEAHDANKAGALAGKVHSSAPVVDGAAVGGAPLTEAAVQVKGGKKPGPLEKLASAAG